MTERIKPTYIPFCSKHPNCCYYKGCPAEFGYDPQSGSEFFKRCDKNCK
ncbi:hypothetical protein [Ornithinibacillus scapharcae]|nr:hypothetical protein [Ornithinibacillus scapharcae]